MHDQIEPYLKRYVLRFPEHDDHTIYYDHRTELTECRCFEIAQALYGNMTTAEVHAALLAGKRIYSYFSYYVLEA